MPGKERGDGANCTVDFVMEGDRDEVVRRLPVEGIWKTRDAGSVLGAWPERDRALLKAAGA